MVVLRRLWQNFAGVHDTSWIKHFFDLSHPFDTSVTLGIMKRMGFHCADSMLCRHGAIMGSFKPYEREDQN